MQNRISWAINSVSTADTGHESVENEAVSSGIEISSLDNNPELAAWLAQPGQGDELLQPVEFREDKVVDCSPMQVFSRGYIFSYFSVQLSEKEVKFSLATLVAGLAWLLPSIGQGVVNSYLVIAAITVILGVINAIILKRYQDIPKHFFSQLISILFLAATAHAIKVLESLEILGKNGAWFAHMVVLYFIITNMFTILQSIEGVGIRMPRRIKEFLDGIKKIS